MFTLLKLSRILYRTLLCNCNQGNATSCVLISSNQKSNNTNMLRKKLKITTPDDENPPENIKDAVAGNQENENVSTPGVSKYFTASENIALSLLGLESDLIRDLNNWLHVSKFKKVKYTYQPLEYASNTHSDFIHRYCNDTKKILFLGMNPGPYGMCQTGVPFGEVNITRDWLKINGDVSKPKIECPERPILGFSCPRSEISGQKFWGLFKKVCKTPETFFRNSFVYNYCPLAFMATNGINITPENIQGDTLKQLEKICNDFLLKIVNLLQVEIIIGIGRYSERKAKDALKASIDLKSKVQVHYLIHPSPIIPKNENWMEKAEERLMKQLNLLSYFEEIN